MLRVALTGGIATGKSGVLARFRGLGVSVIESDSLSREVIAPGTPGADAVRRRFGPQIIGADGTVDRARLGDIVFGDAEARTDLESIIHPAVYARIGRWFEHLAASGQGLGLAEIPLLYETGHQSDFDRVVVTVCETAEQVRRVRERSGLSEAQALQRIAAQMPPEEKARLADYVIRTDGSIEDSNRRTDEVYQALVGIAGQ